MKPFDIHETNVIPLVQAFDFGATADGDPGDSESFAEMLLQSHLREDGQGDTNLGLQLQAGPVGNILEFTLEHAQLSAATTKSLVRFLWEAVRKGHDVLDLQLNPDSFGDLAIQLQLQGNILNLEVRVSDPRVLTMLLSSRNELAAGLARWGIVLERFEAFGPRPKAAVKQQTIINRREDERSTATDSKRSFIEMVI